MKSKISSIYQATACIIFTICLYHVLTNTNTSAWFENSVLVMFSILMIALVLHVINLARRKKKTVFSLIITITIMVCLFVYLNTVDGTGHWLASVFLWITCIVYVIVSFLIPIAGLIKVHQWSSK